MPDTIFIEEVAKNLRANYKKFKCIQSAYLYGSILTEGFHEKSDIDVLFIVDDIKDRKLFFKKVKTIHAKEIKLKLDINIVFKYEFSNLWHIFRPPTFFVWIKHRNALLWGKDCMRDVKEEKITVNSIYKRAVDLAQGCRAVYLNDKDVEFWEIKYSRWLRELQFGILYLYGDLELDSKICGKKLCDTFPELKKSRLLAKKRLPIKDLSEIDEAFVLCVFNHFVKP